jgi:hypothetical protein
MSRLRPCFWTRTIQLFDPERPTIRKSPSPSPNRPGRVAAFTPVIESLPIASILPHFFPQGKSDAGGFQRMWVDPNQAKALEILGFPDSL